ncbi:energy-coupling factor transporter transmembrane protein EcfT [Leptolyngbyaceae cyanobacterium UHCC 1019]
MDLLRSLPLGLFLEQPTTWLHRLDPRIKLAWLLTFLLAPVLATPFWRLLLVGLLLLLTLSAKIPLRVWRQQLGWLTFLCGLIFVLTTLLPDGLNASHQPRLPENELTFSQQTMLPPPPESQSWNPLTWTKSPENSTESPAIALPQPTDYRYVLLKVGSLTATRRSLDLAIRVSTLLFTLLYSTNLFLLTTAPEAVTAAIENWMSPLRRFKVPVTEIALTLTLSLRFIPLVLEEFQNLVRSVTTRAINWKKLGLRRTLQIWLLVAERLLENLLLRAEQIASAMTVRGFTTPNQHHVPWHQFRLRILDWFAIAAIILFWGVRIFWSGSL